MQPILNFPDPPGSPLNGELIQLRLLSSADTHDLKQAAEDCSIFKWFIDGWIILKHGMEAYVYKLLEEQAQEISLPFVVWHLQERRAIGVTRLYNIEKRHLSCEVASWYAKDFHRTRVNTEAKFLLLRYIFTTLRLSRVSFEIDERNVPSIQGMLRIGAIEEGKRRNHMVLADGDFRTSILFSILAEEWPQTKIKLSDLLNTKYS
ncbi:MAG: GNAT family protein [Candidatus Paceibacterota bacterium]